MNLSIKRNPLQYLRCLLVGVLFLKFNINPTEEIQKHFHIKYQKEQSLLMPLPLGLQTLGLECVMIVHIYEFSKTRGQILT